MVDVIYPLPLDRVTEWPGPREGGFHYGTDFRASLGEPLLAAFDGVVVFAGGDGAGGELYPGSGIWANGEGLTVGILRSDGLFCRYGHLSYINVEVGQRVTLGETVIGGAGDTGFSTGIHCHVEFRWDQKWSGGLWVDPRDLGAVDYLVPFPAPPIYGMENDKMLIYYPHARGLNKPGWLLIGFTPKALLLIRQSEANAAAARLPNPTMEVGHATFRNYLRAAGGTAAQLAAVHEVK